MFDRFDSFDVHLSKATLHGRVSRSAGRDRPPLLLLHGHPQTHVMWHKVADRLAEDFTVVVADLRGYGKSSRPATDDRHLPYSKRAMSGDQVELMAHFGFDRFAVCAHDRGARVAHRMMVDHPDIVTRGMLLDIAPTLDMYEGTNRAFAAAYFHWFFLIQPAPLPETLINADPGGYLRGVMGSRHAGLTPFAPEALAAYEEALRQDGAASGICEDYRASATVDLDHEREDRDRGSADHLAATGALGPAGRRRPSVRPARAVAAARGRRVRRALDRGHYVAEEVPDPLYREICEHLGD